MPSLPWAADASESALYLVEVALGRYSSGLVAEWGLPDGFDSDEVAARMPAAPEFWSGPCWRSSSTRSSPCGGYVVGMFF